MDAETVNKLLAINRSFYSEFGGEFSDSRSSEKFNIEPFRCYLASGIRLLDVGCGNGRLAETLERAGYNLDYLGIEQSPELLADAQRRSERLTQVHAHVRQVDIAAPGWSDRIQDAAPFDVVVSLAVLHHIPGFELRLQVLREIRALSSPGGIFVMSNWQFVKSERLRNKIVGWEQVGIQDSRLETGDYLLDWKRGGVGYRYVHLIDENEVHGLARASGFQVVEQYYADNDMNLYSILQNSNL